VYRIAIAIQANPTLFLQQVINGLQLGFVYALIALGYTMVYGIVRLINFAHGDVFMVGAFISYFAISRVQLHLWLGALAPNLAARVDHWCWLDHGNSAIYGCLRLAGLYNRTDCL
jgi:branched-chain amino acid transport system permease protein